VVNPGGRAAIRSHWRPSAPQWGGNVPPVGLEDSHLSRPRGTPRPKAMPIQVLRFRGHPRRAPPLYIATPRLGARDAEAESGGPRRVFFLELGWPAYFFITDGPKRKEAAPAPLYKLVETYRARRLSWQCDAMGHMNTQFYSRHSMTGAGFHFLAMLGPNADPVAEGSRLARCAPQPHRIQA